MHAHVHHGERKIPMSGQRAASQEQVWRRLHGDAARGRLPAGAAPRRGVHRLGVPRQPPEGAPPQHAAVPAALRRVLARQDLQPAGAAQGRAQRGGLLRLPDHARPGVYQFCEAPK